MALQKIYIPRDARADLAAVLREVRSWKRILKTGVVEYASDYTEGRVRGVEMMEETLVQRRRFARKYGYEEAVAMEAINVFETDR